MKKYLLLVVLFILLGCASTPKTSNEVTQKAFEIHLAAVVVDGHNDLPWELRDNKDMKLTKFDLRKRQKFHTDIPRLRKGGLKAQFWSVYVPADTALTGDALLKTLEQIDIVHRMLARLAFEDRENRRSY